MPDTDKLERLADIVRSCIIADDYFDMACWSSCLAGKAAQDDYLQRFGLGMAVIGPRLTRYHNGAPKHLFHYEALEAFFDLDAQQALYLFGNNPDATHEDVCRDWYDVLSRVKEVLRGER